MVKFYFTSMTIGDKVDSKIRLQPMRALFRATPTPTHYSAILPYRTAITLTSWLALAGLPCRCRSA